MKAKAVKVTYVIMASLVCLFLVLVSFCYYVSRSDNMITASAESTEGEEVKNADLIYDSETRTINVYPLLAHYDFDSSALYAIYVFPDGTFVCFYHTSDLGFLKLRDNMGIGSYSRASYGYYTDATHTYAVNGVLDSRNLPFVLSTSDYSSYSCIGLGVRGEASYFTECWGNYSGDVIAVNGSVTYFENISFVPESLTYTFPGDGARPYCVDTSSLFSFYDFRCFNFENSQYLFGFLFFKDTDSSSTSYTVVCEAPVSLNTITDSWTSLVNWFASLFPLVVAFFYNSELGMFTFPGMLAVVMAGVALCLLIFNLIRSFVNARG